MSADFEKAKVVYANMVIRETLEDLYSRWLDEREYEDFAEYAKVLENTVNGCNLGITFVKATKKPFGFQFKTAEKNWAFSINSSSISIKEVH